MDEQRPPSDADGKTLIDSKGSVYGWSDRIEETLALAYDFVSLTYFCIGKIEADTSADLTRQINNAQTDISKLETEINIEFSRLDEANLRDDITSMQIIHDRIMDAKQRQQDIFSQKVLHQNLLTALQQRKNTQVTEKNVKRLNKILNYYARHQNSADPATLIAEQEQLQENIELNQAAFETRAHAVHSTAQAMQGAKKTFANDPASIRARAQAMLDGRRGVQSQQSYYAPQTRQPQSTAAFARPGKAIQQ